jgi:hypothetical protein
MFYLWPEKIWQDNPSNISNYYSFNTVLHQGTLNRRWTTDNSTVLLPTSSKAASSVRWTVSLFNDASSHLLTDRNKSLHYYIIITRTTRRGFTVCHCLLLSSLKQQQQQILQQLHKTIPNSTTQFSYKCACTCPQNVLSASLHPKHALALEGPIQWEIIWHFTCKICQNTPDICWLRFKYLKFIHIHVFTK